MEGQGGGGLAPVRTQFVPYFGLSHVSLYDISTGLS
jgi:hypothetical protein